MYCTQYSDLHEWFVQKFINSVAWIEISILNPDFPERIYFKVTYTTKLILAIHIQLHTHTHSSTHTTHMHMYTTCYMYMYMYKYFFLLRCKCTYLFNWNQPFQKQGGFCYWGQGKACTCTCTCTCTCALIELDFDISHGVSPASPKKWITPFCQQHCGHAWHYAGAPSISDVDLPRPVK